MRGEHALPDREWDEIASDTKRPWQADDFIAGFRKGAAQPEGLHVVPYTACPPEFLHRPFCGSKVMRWLERAIRVGRAVTPQGGGAILPFAYIYPPILSGAQGTALIRQSAVKP
jgi:hypothetical protein